MQERVEVHDINLGIGCARLGPPAGSVVSVARTPPKGSGYPQLGTVDAGGSGLDDASRDLAETPRNVTFGVADHERDRVLPRGIGVRNERDLSKQRDLEHVRDELAAPAPEELVSLAIA